MRPLKLKIFLIATCFLSISRHVSSSELTDLEKNETQIETPPLSVVDIEPKVLEFVDKTNDAITENLKPPDDYAFNEDNPDAIHVVEDGNKSESAQENMIQVFSEWTQQQIQEAEKKLVELTNSTEANKDIKNETLAKHQIVKMRQKNYASPDCGAKILASNPQAQSTSSVLTDKDEYLLSPCTDRIWFVVELCDSIQAQRVELANFELFSSPLKTITISVSNRFPTRDWTLSGQFEAKSERDVQDFDLSSTLFGKFVRVDLTYTNTEHYCPLSFFRIFGTSEIEAFEVENEQTNEVNSMDDEEDFEQAKVEQPNVNLLNRAGAAVMSMVQKAAEVLAKGNGNGNGTKATLTNQETYSSGCMSLSHTILCQHCSNDERNDLDRFISCKSSALANLLDSDRNARNFVVNSDKCNHILGFDLKSSGLRSSSRSFLVSILPEKYISAMCNIIATDQKALPLRTVDIPGINSNLISKKDEVSLKNVSKKEQPVEEDPLCKHDFYATTTVPPELNLSEAGKTVSSNFSETAEQTIEQKNISSTQSGDEHNIFNVVESHEEIQQETSTSTDSEQLAAVEVQGQEKPVEEDKEVKRIQEEEEKQAEVVAELPAIIPLEAGDVKIIPPEVKTTPPETKVAEVKIEQAEIKINGDVRSSNPPESVFLRLSNRIKTLEKNMTLSSQYLEELSRKYKKQIEDVQQSFAKLQALVEGQNQKQRESDKRDVDEKIRTRDDVMELKQKGEYLEVIVIVLSAFFTVQTILVIALFKRISILRTSFALHQQNCDAENAPPSSPNAEKSRTTARKRSKQRMRKISAPNILTQRSPVKTEFAHPPLPVLSRTVSAPNKFSSVTPHVANNENYDDMQAMLEENDDILIPGFEDLQINDDSMSLQSKELDTASTASAVSSNEKHEKLNSNKSFKFKRRLSSPFKSALKTNSNRTNQKAMSESPPRLIPKENIDEIRQSKSFQQEESDDSTVKFKKSNSFKKLFKKLF